MGEEVVIEWDNDGGFIGDLLSVWGCVYSGVGDGPCGLLEC